MKFSELPRRYRLLPIPEKAKLVLWQEDLSKRFNWAYTNEGAEFWLKCHKAMDESELPELKKVVKKFGKIEGISYL